MNAATRVLRRIILSDSTLAAHLATETGHAVRPGDASRVDRPPYILLWRISDQPFQSLTGRLDLNTAMVQVDCYARTKLEAAAMANLVSHAVASFRRGNADAVWVAEITQHNTRDGDERDHEGGDKPLAVVQTDYRLTYLDSAPPTLPTPSPS